MNLDDEARIELAKEALVSTVDKICEANSTLSAVMVVTDGVGLLVVPVRITKNEAFSLLVAACTALEPEDLKTSSGELH
jgi:hypothetical protein